MVISLSHLYSKIFREVFTHHFIPRSFINGFIGLPYHLSVTFLSVQLVPIICSFIVCWEFNNLLPWDRVIDKYVQLLLSEFARAIE